ncbi:C40 family peptidase [uncultured Bacteroides sp.]|nr:C40 family peptidase [uncultured Bacteroides sp.]
MLSFSSCGTRRLNYDFRDLAAAAIRLDMDIDLKDNHKLYLEAADWIGTPYRYGGTTKKGVDCSGLTMSIYRTVYRKKLSRNSEEQRDKDCQRVLKRNLREGDLVFFHNGKKKRRASHVGIYLKDGRFIHASTSVGVVVSSLNERYYSSHWLQGGRVK